MIGLTIAAIIAFLGFYFYYTFSIKPKRTMKHYQELLESLGYKVVVFPFKFLHNSFYFTIWKDQVQKKDGYYFAKHVTSNYDIGIYNVLSDVVLEMYKPELVQQFLGPNNPYLYQKMPEAIMNIRRVFGDGIGVAEGVQWKKKRKAMNAIFNYDFLKANIPKITRICNMSLERTLKSAQKLAENPKVLKFNVLDMYSEIYGNVMLQCFFGLPVTFEEVQGKPITSFISDLMIDTFTQMKNPLSLLFGRKYLDFGVTSADKEVNRKIKIYRNIGIAKLEEKLRKIETEGMKNESTDIVEALVKNNNLKRDHKTEGEFSFDELVTEFTGFYMAGTDTTARLTQMMLYYLSLHPRCWKIVYDEVTETFKSDKDITSENIKNMTYLDWVQSQTTRMYGPGNSILARYAIKDHMILDIPIKKGMALGFTSFSNHYNTKFYPDPFQFKPERWESGLKDNHPYALCGFSGGPRTCIGKHLALLQSKIGVIKFMMIFKELKLPKQDFSMIADFLYEPENFDIEATLKE